MSGAAPRELRPDSPVLRLPHGRWAVLWAVIALTIVILLGHGIADPVEAILAEAGALVALCGLGLSWSRGLLPTTAVFYCFWFSWLGLAPLVQITTGKVAWGDLTALNDHGVVDQALMLTDVALFAFIGGQLGASRAARRPSVLAGPIGRQARVRGWVLTAVIVALIAVAPHAIATNGGIATYFSSRGQRGETLASAGADLSSAGGVDYALISALPIALSVATALLALLRLNSGWQGWRRVKVLDLVALVIGITAVAVFANPLANTRFIGITGIGALLILMTRPRSARAGAIFVGVALVGTLVLYPLGNYFRGGVYTQDTLLNPATYTSDDFDGFQQVINSMDFVHDLGLSGGRYIVSAVGYFIPRSLWTGKEIPASLDVAAHANYTFVNLSEPIHAELYVEFGWVGVVLGMALLGYAIRRADEMWRAGSSGRAAAVVPYLAVAILGIIRGPLGAQVPIYLTVLVLLWAGLARPDPMAGWTGASTAAPQPNLRRGSAPTGAGRTPPNSPTGPVATKGL
ncbi:hypothetical protein [Amnibacterium sp.]|uniref:hypothetical protein n=1 Tax=Amnibacterium sp. TaxID=1872496 RepID=UPI00260216C4|nr:hypothetical protein [Amnibacterium sp.]MCU1473896.1 hypothetical protein [Amnibacterium sp.]